MAIVLVLAIGGILATFAFLQSKGKGEKSGQDAAKLEKIKSALVQFAAVNGRLPCPANPAANPETGAENRTALSATCNSPAGTVPWSSIGIRRDDAIDAWGWRISYRVYTGTAGSLTQDGGASTVTCDKVEPWPTGLTPVAGSSGGLCRISKDTLESTFLASGKGLSLAWFGTPIADAAYVLISHGPSGLGAYTAAAPSTQTPPLPTNAFELSNLNAAGPFVAATASGPGVGPSDAAHFDDVVGYQTVADLIRLAGLGARDWPDAAGLADITLNMATVTAALGQTPGYGSLGQATLNVGSARATGLLGSGTQNLTFDTSGGTEGLGVAGGTTGMSSSTSEGIRLEFGIKATQFAVTLNDFGTVGPRSEQVRFDFYDGAGVAPVASVVKQGCRPDGGLASFTIDLGTSQFDKVEIFPIETTVFPVGGTAINSSFYLSAFKTCLAGACQTSLYAAGNACS